MRVAALSPGKICLLCLCFLLYYLHDDRHHFRVGGVDALASGVPRAEVAFPAQDTGPLQRSVRSPVLFEPGSPWLLRWQMDSQTRVVAPIVFDGIDQHLPQR